MTVPDGFAPHSRKSPVTLPWEPIYARETAEAYVLGLRLADAHCNSRGLLHGGVIAALADNAMGLSVARAYDPPTSPITINLAVDYMGQAHIGQWIEFTTDFIKPGNSLAFAGALVTADGVAVARASATFRISQR